MNASDAAAALQERTKHTWQRIRTEAHGLDWGNHPVENAEDYSPGHAERHGALRGLGDRRGPVGAACGDRTQPGRLRIDGDPGAEDRPGPWRWCGVHPPDVPALRQEGGPDLSQLLRAGPRPRSARATTRGGGETWRQRLTATPRPTSAGTSSGTAVGCGALVADTAIHTTLSCHGGREGLPGRGGQRPVADRRGGSGGSEDDG